VLQKKTAFKVADAGRISKGNEKTEKNKNTKKERS
jgi:hypothetical protein